MAQLQQAIVDVLTVCGRKTRAIDRASNDRGDGINDGHGEQ